MKYTLTIESEDKEILQTALNAHDWYSIVWELQNAARSFWKYSEDDEEVKKGEWLRDLIWEELTARGLDL